MTLRIPSAAKVLIALTAVGFLLSGCHYYRPAYGGPHYAPPGHSYKHHYKGKRHGDRHRYYRQRYRGYR